MIIRPLKNVILSSAMVVMAPSEPSKSEIQPAKQFTNGIDLMTHSGLPGPKLLVIAHSTDRWDETSVVRFRHLARKEAGGKLVAEELAELEDLTRLRRTTFPRTADQILWQRRQRNLTQLLISALEAYVEFHEGPSST